MTVFFLFLNSKEPVEKDGKIPNFSACHPLSADSNKVFYMMLYIVYSGKLSER